MEIPKATISFNLIHTKTSAGRIDSTKYKKVVWSQLSFSEIQAELKI